MEYSSERFTRILILSVFSRMKDRERYAVILTGSNRKSGPDAKEVYFKYGSSLFTVVGVALMFLGGVAMVLTLILYGLLGFGFFFYYAPGAMLLATGYVLGLLEKKAHLEEDAVFTVGHLILSLSAGIFIALFIATFSALNLAMSKL